LGGGGLDGDGIDVRPQIGISGSRKMFFVGEGGWAWKVYPMQRGGGEKGMKKTSFYKETGSI